MKRLIKRGQITIVIVVVGIIIVASMLALYFFGNMRKATTAPESPFYVAPIKDYIESCIKVNLDKGLYLSAMKGGYIYNPKYSLITEKDEVVYYYYLAKNTYPNESQINSDLSRFVSEALPACLGDFKAFRGQGYNFSTGAFNADLVLGEGGTTMVADYPVTISYNGQTTRLSTFSAYSSIRLKLLYDYAIEITDKQAVDNKLSFPNPENNITFNIFPYDGETTIITIADKSTSPSTLFMFGIKKMTNSPPVLEFIPNFKIRQGEPFSYQLKATDADNDEIFFDVDRDGIVIDPITHIMSFTSQYAGEFTVVITASDINGGKDSQEVQFTIDPVDADERIMADNPGTISIPTMTDFIYHFNAFSLKGEKLTCKISTALMKFDQDCNLIFASSYNLVPGNFDATITVTDESGYSKDINVTFQIYQSTMFDISPIPDQNAKVGQEFKYQVVVTKKGNDAYNAKPLKFNDNTDMFNIKQDGSIDFIPSSKGTFPITIEVSDYLGNKKTEDFDLIVT